MKPRNTALKCLALMLLMPIGGVNTAYANETPQDLLKKVDRDTAWEIEDFCKARNYKTTGKLMDDRNYPECVANAVQGARQTVWLRKKYQNDPDFGGMYKHCGNKTANYAKMPGEDHKDHKVVVIDHFGLSYCLDSELRARKSVNKLSEDYDPEWVAIYVKKGLELSGSWDETYKWTKDKLKYSSGWESGLTERLAGIWYSEKSLYGTITAHEYEYKPNGLGTYAFKECVSKQCRSVRGDFSWKGIRRRVISRKITTMKVVRDDLPHEPPQKNLVGRVGRYVINELSADELQLMSMASHDEMHFKRIPVSKFSD